MKPGSQICARKNKAIDLTRDLSLYIWYQTKNNESLPDYTNTPLSENVGVMFTLLNHGSALLYPTSSNIGPNVIDMHACMVYYVYRTKVLHTQ